MGQATIYAASISTSLDPDNVAICCFLKSRLMETRRFKINSAWRMRSSWEMSLVRSSSMRPISLVKSSDSVGRPTEAIDRIPGRTVDWAIGEECVELGVDSRDGGEGDLYILPKGGSLYWISPDVRRGYKEEGFERDVVNTGVRWSESGNLASRVWGRARGAPGSVLSGIIGRFDMPM